MRASRNSTMSCLRYCGACALALVLMLASLPISTMAWHASLGQRAAPIVHATSQRGDLELPRSQDVLNDRCLVLTTSAQKLHLVCNTTCDSDIPCDWNCKAVWNSFLRDAHSVEGLACQGYAKYLAETLPGSALVPSLPTSLAKISRGYLLTLIESCLSACPSQQDREDENFYPCGRIFDEGGDHASTFEQCKKSPSLAIPSCFPIAPSDSFSVTDGNRWFPFLTWGAVAHYKKNNLGNTGGFVSHAAMEVNEYSSWACVWEERSDIMRVQRKMACFRYSHIRGEFHWWQWSDQSYVLSNEVLDVWVVYASFCDHEARPTYINARDRKKMFLPSQVEYNFKRLHRDGNVRSAISQTLSSLGDKGCNVIKLQRDLQYSLEVKVNSAEEDEYFRYDVCWTSPTKIQMATLAAFNVATIPITIPIFPMTGLECSSLAFTLTWCENSPVDIDIVLFKPNSISPSMIFDPDTKHAVINKRRIEGQYKMMGMPKYGDSRPSYSVEIEMEDDGFFYDSGARSYGPETIYMFGDLEEGTYAVMAYVVSSTGLDKFEGCEAISMFSGMPGKTQNLATVYVGEKAWTGDWWHAFNIRVKKGPTSNLKSFEYGIIDVIYDGPMVCQTGCGIGGNVQGLFRPLMSELMVKEEWKMSGKVVDPRALVPTSGYRTLMTYDAVRRSCEILAYIQIQAMDAVTGTQLPGAMMQIDGRPGMESTSDYRLTRNAARGCAGQGYSGGFMITAGEHSFTVTRTGYISHTFTLQIPSGCEGKNCLPTDVIYHEVYLIPNDGNTRVVLNWGDKPMDVDLIIMPVGVMGLDQEKVSWRSRTGSNITVYGYKDWSQLTSEYGAGREPYASKNLAIDGLCKCEYTCKENASFYPFVCSHYGSTRMRCDKYEQTWNLKPPSQAGHAPLCVTRSGIMKEACCCNKPDLDGTITCKDGSSDAWCCPNVEEIPGSLCQPTCSMNTASAAQTVRISIDRNEAGHNLAKEDTDGKYVNRPEVATFTNLLPGMYKIYANAFSPSESFDMNTFGKRISIDVYFGDGDSKTVLIDTVTENDVTGKWFYAGYIMATTKQKSCKSAVKMLQKYASQNSCYSWFKAGFPVSSPLSYKYGAVKIRIASASNRDEISQPDFSGVQFSVHAGGQCTCISIDLSRGCRCTGSEMLHSGALGPMVDSNEEAKGWTITAIPIYFRVHPGRAIWMVLRDANYNDELISLGTMEPIPLGAPVPVKSATVVQKPGDGELRIVLSFSKIEDGDLYIFKDPIPGKYESDGTTNQRFVYWKDKKALPGIRLEQDCTTNECGVETMYFTRGDDHAGATYSVVVNVYAGVNQNSKDGKCVEDPAVCVLQGTSSAPDEVVRFFDQHGLIAEIKYISSDIAASWWLAAKVKWDDYKWTIDTSVSQRAYCTPNSKFPSVPGLMEPDCVV